MGAAVDTKLVPLATELEVDDDLIHLVCECDTDMALCGVKIPGDCWIPDGCDIERDCVVCLDLEDKPCGRRGCTGA